MKYSVDDDGITHINMYSKARTELGRLLSNFAHTPITTPQNGKFNSIEGYWYWLLAAREVEGKDVLRTLSGFEAKEKGREIVGKDWPEQNDELFRFQIYQALFAKVIQTKGLEASLVKSSLPFTHYYAYNGKIIDVGGWFVEAWEQIRADLKERHKGVL